MAGCVRVSTFFLGCAGTSCEEDASSERGRQREPGALPGLRGRVGRLCLAHGRRLRGRLADMAPPVPLCLLLAPPAAHNAHILSMRTLCSPECMSLLQAGGNGRPEFRSACQHSDDPLSPGLPSTKSSSL